MGLSLKKIGRSIEKVGKKAISTVGDIGTDVYKTASKATQQTLGNIEKGYEQVSSGVSDVYHGVGELGENVGKEIDRNKYTIMGSVLAPVTGGASLALAAKDDTTLGEAVEKGFESVGDKINWSENRYKYMGALAGLATGGALGGLGAMIGGTAAGTAAGEMIGDAPIAQRKEQRIAEARANQITREAAMMSKQGMLANELTMTARRAMSKRAQSNLRKNTPTAASQFLGGEQQTLG